LESEIFAEGLMTETNTQEGSITTDLDDFDNLFHFSIIFIIDITWTTSEDKDIFLCT
jgi:hypothetical protein